MADEARIFDLVCRRLLSAWHDDHIWSVTTVITLVRSGAEPVEDRFHSSGTAIQQVGWKVLDIGGGKKAPRKKSSADDSDDAPGEDGQTLPPDLAEGQPQRVLDIESVAKKTRPPKRLTEGTLLTAMETAGKTLDDKELSAAMKESGLGTPATRAQIIEVLLKRGFIVRRGKSLEATDKGIRLIDIVHPEVKSPAMTGQWEAYLKRIERGQAQLTPFIKGIEDYVREVVGKVGSTTAARPAPPPIAASAVTTASGPRPARVLERSNTGDLHDVLRKSFGFEAFRPNQENVCRVADLGTRRVVGNADRLGEVVVLSVARRGARWDHAGGQSSNRADGRSGREAERIRVRGRTHPFEPRPQRIARSLHRVSRREARLSVHRARASARPRLPRDAGETKAVPDRDR